MATLREQIQADCAEKMAAKRKGKTMVDQKTRKQIHEAAKSFAGYLVRHPMLGSLMAQTMSKWSIPTTEETQSLMLEETAAHLNRMVNGQ